MHSPTRPAPAADPALTREELVHAVTAIRPTLLLVAELPAVRSVAPTLRADLVRILGGLLDHLRAPAVMPLGMASELDPMPGRGEIVVAETIHILVDGKALCRTVSGLPVKWPIGHAWVRREAAHTIPLARRCGGCFESR
ncbi:MAG: hypothetical protein ACREU5_06990 [Burkholderiales bacterium]